MSDVIDKIKKVYPMRIPKVEIFADLADTQSYTEQFNQVVSYLNKNNRLVRESVIDWNKVMEYMLSEDYEAKRAIDIALDIQSQFNYIKQEIPNADAEVVIARDDAFGHRYKTLKERLDTEQLKTANKDLIGTEYQFLSIASNRETNATPCFYISKNLKEMTPLNKGAISGIDPYFKDASIIFNNGKFYIAYTDDTQTEAVKSFKLAVSDDLKTFVTFAVNVGEYAQVNSPQFVKFSDGYRIVVSTNDGTNVINNKGETVPFYQPLLLKPLDDTFLQWGTPQTLLLPTGVSSMFNSMQMFNNEFHLFVVENVNNTLVHYKSYDLTQTFQVVDSFGNVQLNPANIYNNDGLYYVHYTDLLNGFLQVRTSDDMINWSTVENVKSTDDERMLSLSTMKIDSTNWQKIETASFKYLLNVLAQKENVNRNFNNIILLDNVVMSTTLKSNEIPNDSLIYGANQGATSISTIDAPSDGKGKLSIVYISGGEITLSTGGNILLPNNKPLILGSSTGLQNVIIGLEYHNNNWYVTSIPSKVNPTAKGIDLTTLANTSGVIQTLIAVPNGAYFLTDNASKDITISNIDASALQDLERINFYKAGTIDIPYRIIIKGVGNGIKTPYNADIIVNAMNDIIELGKINSSYMRCLNRSEYYIADWTTLTLLNSFQPYNAEQTPQYRIRVLNGQRYLDFRGAVISQATMNDTTYISSLPTSYFKRDISFMALMSVGATGTYGKPSRYVRWTVTATTGYLTVTATSDGSTGLETGKWVQLVANNILLD